MRDEVAQIPEFAPSEAAKLLAQDLRKASVLSSHALAALVEQNDVMNQHLRWQSERIVHVEAQARKTNGRVNTLESTIESESSFKKGAIWVVSGVGAVLMTLSVLLSDHLVFIATLTPSKIQHIAQQKPVE